MKNSDFEILFEGDWLTLKKIPFRTREGETAHWEAVARKNSKALVLIIAVLKPSNRLVLISQFRPAVGKSVINFPAGICETHDIASHALKELKEETGYTGTITQISPPTVVNPAIIDDVLYIVHADINENASENRYPMQKLEPEEDIQVHLVERSNLNSFIHQMTNIGHIIHAALWFYMQ